MYLWPAWQLFVLIGSKHKWLLAHVVLVNVLLSLLARGKPDKFLVFVYSVLARAVMLTPGRRRPACGCPCEEVIFEWSYFKQLVVRTDVLQIGLVGVVEHADESFETVGVLVQHALLFEHFDFLLVHGFVDALVIAEVHVLVLFAQSLQAPLHHLNFEAGLLFFDGTFLFLSVELFACHALALHQRFNGLALLL